MSMNRSRAAVTWGTSNASSVKPVRAPSARAISFTGMLMLMTPMAAWMASSMMSRFCWICLRSPTPYTTVESPTARYGATGLRSVFLALVSPGGDSGLMGPLPSVEPVAAVHVDRLSGDEDGSGAREIGEALRDVVRSSPPLHCRAAHDLLEQLAGGVLDLRAFCLD